LRQPGGSGLKFAHDPIHHITKSVANINRRDTQRLEPQPRHRSITFRIPDAATGM